MKRLLSRDKEASRFAGDMERFSGDIDLGKGTLVASLCVSSRSEGVTPLTFDSIDLVGLFDPACKARLELYQPAPAFLHAGGSQCEASLSSSESSDERYTDLSDR